VSAPWYRNAEQYGKRTQSNKGVVMPLKLRPTGLGAGIDKDRQDFTIYSGEWAIGRIYETRGGPETLRWFWSFTVTCPMTRSDRVPTLEEAKAQFETAWRQWLAWAGLQEMP
jgi:hypothetical protein